MFILLSSGKKTINKHGIVINEIRPRHQRLVKVSEEKRREEERREESGVEDHGFVFIDTFEARNELYI